MNTKAKLNEHGQEVIHKSNVEKVQKRMILDFMGVPLHEQPKLSTEINDMLRLARAAKPQEYQRAINIVLKKQIPDVIPTQSDSQNKKDLVKADFAQIAQEVIGEYEAKAIRDIGIGIDLRIDHLTKKLNDEFADRGLDLVKALEQAIAKEAKKYNRIEIKIGNKAPVKFDSEVVPEEFPKLLRLAVSRKNILMVGPSGCGKTYVAGLIAKALGLNYASQSCSAGVSESAFVGWLIPIKNGEFVHVPSQFVEMYEKGGVFLFDEIDASDPNVLVFINQALANDHFFLPQRFDKPKVTKHKNFVAIGAANTFGTGADAMYTARNVLDEATRDRFRAGTVILDYSAAVEEKLVEPSILAWGRSVRRVIKHHRMRKIMSTRVMLDGTDLMRDHEDYTLETFKETFLLDWTAEEQRVLTNEIGV